MTREHVSDLLRNGGNRHGKIKCPAHIALFFFSGVCPSLVKPILKQDLGRNRSMKLPDDRAPQSILVAGMLRKPGILQMNKELVHFDFVNRT